jgi:hypothetical protein
MAAAACLASCGILPRVARQTAAAAISPIASTARTVSQDLRVVSQNIAASSAASAQTARQVSLSSARARAASRAAQQRRAQNARIAKQNEALAKQAKSDGAPSEPLDILPAAVLAQLTKDQAALQRAAQTEAFTAPVGETIYWEDSGRTGSAMAETENAMGSFVCRTFVQTIKITESEERASTLACKNPDGIWQASLNRSEFLP